MLNIEEATYSDGISLWHLGFRPFFLGAGLWAVAAMLLWMAIYSFGVQLDLGGLPPVLWHGHEMVFGYALAVIAGFLLTAVRNWTNVQTLHGAALAGLFLLWLAARIALLLPGVPLLAAAVPDLLFGLALIASLAWPVIKARQWKQLVILAVVSVLVGFNALFYARELGMIGGDGRWALFGGVWLVLLLIGIMAGRVVPMFVQNGVGGGVEVMRYRWVERLAMPSLLAFVLLQLFAADSRWLPWVAGFAALLHGVRLFGWYLRGIWSRPLVWVLYVAYVWLVLGLALFALGGLFPAAGQVALHGLVYGVIGIITVGMMSRVSIGHTGRMVLTPPKGLAPVFVLLALGGVVRVLLPLVDMAHYSDWILASQGLWVAAFALFVFRFAAMLVKPRVDGRYG